MEEYHYTRSRTFKIRIMGCIIAILLLWLASFYINKGDGANLITIVTEIISSIIGMLVVFLVWEIAKNRRDEERHDKYIESRLMSIMRMDNVKSLIPLYNEAAIDDIVKNCLSFYNKDLAVSYLNYYKANRTSYRTGMNYRVEIGKSENVNGEIIYNQSQILSYKRHFRVDALEEEYSFQCFFALRSKLLEEKMNQSIWFFREFITDKKMIQDIRDNITDKVKIIRLLNLEMFVNDLETHLSPNEIIFEPYWEKIENEKDENREEITGLIFRVPLRKDSFEFNPDFPNAHSGYVSYSAKISVDLKSTNSFYCVFPEPCLKPKFSIRFDDSIEWKSIDRITCLSVPMQPISYTESQKSYTWIDEKRRMRLYVESGLFVFPRSGIYFTWDHCKI